MSVTPVNPSAPHDEVAAGLGRIDQRYTRGRRALVEVLAGADRPLTVPEILAASGAAVPQSSAYRSLTVLIDAGVVRRVTGTDDMGRFELAEDLRGHHHHLHCVSCGTVADVQAAPRLERALAAAAQLAADETGFAVIEHRIDLVGHCAGCR
ncbi:MAG: transcriptional repressor [Actinobacteria bacterium]|nr:transcriptional repressor [Actinomycetota bacterium]